MLSKNKEICQKKARKKYQKLSEKKKKKKHQYAREKYQNTFDDEKKHNPRILSQTL